jgi:tryptophan-rich sensory protein
MNLYMGFTILTNPGIHIITPIIFAISMNSLIYRYKLLHTNKRRRKYLPPGYVIGIIWTILLGILGYVHYLLYRFANYRETFMSKYVIFIIIFCVFYPIFVYLFPKINGLLDIVTFGLAVYLFVFINLQYQLYILPFLLWSFYVAIITCL